MTLWAAATEADAVAGMPARFVAAPASTDEAAAVLRAAAEQDLAVVVRGGGTKLEWGMPPRRLDLQGRRYSVERIQGDAAAPSAGLDFRPAEPAASQARAVRRS